jgi:hypothetical protein
MPPVYGLAAVVPDMTGPPPAGLLIFGEHTNEEDGGEVSSRKAKSDLGSTILQSLANPATPSPTSLVINLQLRESAAGGAAREQRQELENAGAQILSACRRKSLAITT